MNKENEIKGDGFQMKSKAETIFPLNFTSDSVFIPASYVNEDGSYSPFITTRYAMTQEDCLVFAFNVALKIAESKKVRFRSLDIDGNGINLKCFFHNPAVGNTEIQVALNTNRCFLKDVNNIVKFVENKVDLLTQEQNLFGI